MGWERRNNRRYYYRAKWVNGRVVKEYVGRGRAAEAAAAEDASRQEMKQVARDENKNIAEAGDLNRELTDITSLLVEAALLAAGMYLHDRTWRVRNGRKKG